MITFNDVPTVLQQILNEVTQISEIKLAIDRLEKRESDINQPIDGKALCKYLKISEPTLCRMRKQKRIPYMELGNQIRYDLRKVIAALDKPKNK